MPDLQPFTAAPEMRCIGARELLHVTRAWGLQFQKQKLNPHLRKRQVPTVSLIENLFLSYPAALRLHQVEPMLVGESDRGSRGVGGLASSQRGARLLRPLRGHAQSAALILRDFSSQ